MALMQSTCVSLSRQLMRLSLLSTSYAASPGTCGSLLEPGVNSSIMGHQILPSQSLLLGGIRSKYGERFNYKEARKRWKDENAIDCYGFTYYPRHKNHKDPPIESAKLFMVKRVRSLYGCPWWEKRLIRHLKLELRNTVGIFKNTPSMNKLLYSVKHLVEITPITTPQGLPDSPENGFLKENGELVVYNPLKLYGEDANLETAEKQIAEYNEKTIGGYTLKRRLHLRWYSRFDIV